MAALFMQRYSAHTRLNIKDQWLKWYHTTQRRASELQALIDALKASNTRPTSAQRHQMRHLLETVEENQAHLLKLDGQLRDHANMTQLIQRHGGFRPWGQRRNAANAPQQGGGQALLFFVDARLKCNRCKAVGNQSCVLAAGSVRCTYCATVAKRPCHWGNIHLSGEVYMHDSDELVAHYNGRGFTILKKTRQPEQWVECFKNIEAATDYLVRHAFEFRGANLPRKLSDANRYTKTEWPPAAIAAFKVQGSRFYRRTKELTTIVLPLGHEVEYPLVWAPQREGSDSPMRMDDADQPSRAGTHTPRHATPGPADPRSSIPPPMSPFTTGAQGGASSRSPSVASTQPPQPRTLSSVELGYPSSSLAGGAHSSMATSPAPSAYDGHAGMPLVPVAAPTTSAAPAPIQGVESTLHSALAAGLEASGERESLELINGRIERAREAIQHVNDAIAGRDQPMEADDYGLEDREAMPTGEGSREPSRHSSAASAMSTPPLHERSVIADSRGPTTSLQETSSTTHTARPSTSAMLPPTTTHSGGVDRLRYGGAVAPPASHQRSQPPQAGPSHLGMSTSQAAQAAPMWTVATPLGTTSESESEQVDELQSDTSSVAPCAHTRNVGRGSHR
ncbi:hypothetical protein BD414DRAFT_507422 [Trametes punicea]|nr:hypothetical protein BD414DRAFT_507422 [Trametes punicea]